MAGFIFGGDTGLTYEGLQRRRKIAEQLMQGKKQPRNAIEGLGSAAESIAGALMGRKLDKQEGKMREDFNSEFAGLFGGFGGGQATPASAPRQPAASGGGMDAYRNAIASIESAGSGDYAAVGPTNDKLGRALGRYQIMEANIGPWSREALGREVSPDEFLANPELQDAIFDQKFGGYVERYGPEGAAQAWFAGPGGVGKMGRKDVLGTSVSDYTQKFTNALGGASGGSGGRSGPNVQRIAQVMAMANNPMATPAQQQVAQILLQRELQSGDPMRAMELEKAQLELERLRQPEAPEMTSGQREYQMAVQQGYDGTFMDYKQALANASRSQTNITNQMGNPVEPLGTEGQILVQDPNAPGGYRVEIAPGSKLDVERQKSAQQSEIAQQQKETSTGIVLDEISLARDLIGDQTTFNPTTGLTGKAASLIDSTNAGKLKNRLTTIKANIGFDKLQSMREASPTGGALGAVSEFENRLLQAVYGSLEQAQDDQELLYNLDRLESVYNRVINEGIPDDEARQMYREIVTGEQASPRQMLSVQTPSQDAIPAEPPDFLGAQDLELWPYFTDEEKAMVLKSYGQSQ